MAAGLRDAVRSPPPQVGPYLPDWKSLATCSSSLDERVSRFFPVLWKNNWSACCWLIWYVSPCALNEYVVGDGVVVPWAVEDEGAQG
jgi:hypothetical protein